MNNNLYILRILDLKIKRCENDYSIKKKEDEKERPKILDKKMIWILKKIQKYGRYVLFKIISH